MILLIPCEDLRNLKLVLGKGCISFIGYVYMAHMFVVAMLSFKNWQTNKIMCAIGVEERSIVQLHPSISLGILSPSLQKLITYLNLFFF